MKRRHFPETSSGRLEVRRHRRSSSDVPGSGLSVYEQASGCCRTPTCGHSRRCTIGLSSKAQSAYVVRSGSTNLKEDWLDSDPASFLQTPKVRLPLTAVGDQMKSFHIVVVRNPCTSKTRQCNHPSGCYLNRRHRRSRSSITTPPPNCDVKVTSGYVALVEQGLLSEKLTKIPSRWTSRRSSIVGRVTFVKAQSWWSGLSATGGKSPTS